MDTSSSVPPRLELAPAEIAELDAFTYGAAVPSDLTPERFQFRKAIAAKTAAHLEAVSGFAPAVRQVLRQYPFDGFYTNKEGTAIRRAYGVVEYDDGTFGLRMVSLLAGWVNNVLNGVPLDDVVRVEEWTDEQKSRMQVLANAHMTTRRIGAFSDPLGFVKVLKDRAVYMHIG